VAYQTIDPQPYYTNTNNGLEYLLQYDPTDGSVRMVEAGVTAVTQSNIIFVDGQFTQAGVDIGITGNLAEQLFDDAVTTIQNAYNTSGGNTNNNSVLPQWADPTVTGPPGNRSQSPSNSPNSGSSINPFNTLIGTLGNPFGRIQNVSVNNSARWRSTNANELFRENMLYPIDLQTGKQDCLVIRAYRYVPVNQGLLTQSQNNNQFAQILTSGLQRGNDRVKDPIGTVFLPMPAGLTDTKGVSWGQGNLNTFNAAVANKVGNDTAGVAGIAALGALFAASLKMGGAAGAKYGTQLELYKQASNAATNSPDAQALIGAGLVDRLTNYLGFGVDAETILARGAGVVSNQNTELLFQGPTLRTFSCAYRLTARSRAEAEMIRKIIRFFKQVSSPKKVFGGAGNSSIFLGTPDVFELKFCTRNFEEIPGVSRFKTCALTQITTDFTPDRQWLAFDDGQPVSTTIMLQFAELEPVYENDYQSYVSANRNTTLRSVADDSVGY